MKVVEAIMRWRHWWQLNRHIQWTHAMHSFFMGNGSR
jgi:hypothetical protein